MHQFFIPASQEGREFVTILGADVNHIKNVLRMKAGEEIRVSSETGRDYFCRITELTEKFVQADILREAQNTELPSKIYLFQALPKGSRMETVIQKAVELGVYEIIPVVMKYCVVKLEEKKAAAKVKRWQAIAESAAKQAKRSIVPNVRMPMDFSQAVGYAENLGGACIAPYENERGMAAAKAAFRAVRPGEPVSVLIGPEGGFAPEEIEAVRPMADVVSLGKRILRTDTAAVAVLAALMLYLETAAEDAAGGAAEETEDAAAALAVGMAQISEDAVEETEDMAVGMAQISEDAVEETEDMAVGMAQISEDAVEKTEDAADIESGKGDGDLS